MKTSLFVLLTVALFTCCTSKAPYQDKTLTPSDRAADLVSRLTLVEKVSLMQNSSSAVERLGIRPYEWWNEALHGVARSGLATVFPQAIGMAASFDDELLFHVFDAVSDEARVKNRIAKAKNSYRRYEGLTFWTPNINIFRDPRWGRGQETYGEDPYLTSCMGLAVVRGLQGPSDAVYNKAHACAKHFAVHSGPEWERHSFDAANIDDRDLWETYLPAFKTLVQKGGVKEVMCAYNRYEGDPCCGSDRLLTQILRQIWDYQGIVVSDCNAIHNFYTKGEHETHPDATHAAAAAVLSGTDLECFFGRSTYDNLLQAVEDGLISEEDINVSVRRLMQVRFELGEMDNNTPWDTLIPDSVLDCAAHKLLALKMARETMVLLQNNGILPLGQGQKIALIGPNANDSVMQWANYNGFPSHTVTLLEALTTRLGADNVYYSPVCDLTSDILYKSVYNLCTTENGQGFDVTYYHGKDFEGEPISTVRHTSPFQLNTDGATAFAPNVPLTDFCGVYRSNLKLTEPAEVEFLITVSGEYILEINGERVASEDGFIGKPEVVYTLDAKAGQTYDIALKFIQNNVRGAIGFDLGVQKRTDIPALLSDLEGINTVIFAGGISSRLEGEEMSVNAPGFYGGDRTDIQLPAVQRNVIRSLKQAGKKVVLVNFSGSAIGLLPESKICDAILQAWYPGQAGGTAITDVLVGDYNPAGRLPVTFYKDTTQLADFRDYSMKGRTYRYMTSKPLFPFGYGLSYTSFAYSRAKVSDGRLCVTVTNIGERDGEEVVQLYLNRPSDTEGPLKALRGFKRVAIPAGESREVEFILSDELFEWWDASTNTVHPLAGGYKLLYGGSSCDDDLQWIEYDYAGI